MDLFGLTNVSIGFTGTQVGMTAKQKQEIQEFLEYQNYCIFRHGDCIGADCQAHHIADKLGYRIIIHPPNNPNKRAFCTGSQTSILLHKPYLDRNHDIVDNSDILIACPKENTEQLRSETWATIRYARKKGKQVYLIIP